MRRCVSLLLVLAGTLLSAGSGVAQSSSRPVVVAEIKGIINPVMANYVTRVLDAAERDGASAVVFTMDTPGGLSDAMREINQRILAARVPVVVYVAPDGARAGSAGAYITYAAHVAAMAPATNIGSATPVSLGQGGEQTLSPEMRTKVNNDAVAQIRALADQRGRNADFAERAVREGANLQAADALSQNVVDIVATDLPDLLRQLNGRQVALASGNVTLRTETAPVQRAPMSFLDELLLAITNPTIAYILLSVGSLGLVLELYNPGSIFPGVIGGICVLLALYALGTLSLNFAAVGLIVFGLALFALEPFVTSHGVVGVGGVGAFLAGSLLLATGSDAAPFLRVSLVAVVAMTSLLLLFLLVITAAVVRSSHRRIATGREALIGAYGVVRTAIRPGEGNEGLVMLQGELWTATAESPLVPGQEIVVERMDGLTLRVRARSLAASPGLAASTKPDLQTRTARG